MNCLLQNKQDKPPKKSVAKRIIAKKQFSTPPHDKFAGVAFRTAKTRMGQYQAVGDCCFSFR
jgi:hypothetical protein